MRFPLSSLVAIGVGVLAFAAQSQVASRVEPVSFVREVAPVLQQKCLTCHGPEKQKGGYRLDSFDWLLRAGDSDEAPVVPSGAGAGTLLRLVTAEDEDDRMPQQDDPLPGEFIETLKRWLAEGAKFDGPNPKQSLADLVPPLNHPAPPEVYPHAIPVLSLALIEEGRLAIGGYHEILIRELPSGKLRQRLTNLPERIHALLPVNEGRRLLYAGGYPGRAGEVGLIDLEGATSGAAPKVLARAADTALALAITGDGRQVAAGGADKLIRVIDIASGLEVRQLAQHSDWVMGLAYSADGTRLASASRDGTARVFDPATGEMICAFREHNGPVFAVAFVHPGTEAVSAGRDGTLRFWSTDKGEQRASLKDFGGAVFQLTHLGGGLLAAGADGGLREVVVGERRLGARQVARDGVALLKVIATVNSPQVIVGTEDGYVVLLEPKDTEAGGQFMAWPLRTPLP